MDNTEPQGHTTADGKKFIPLAIIDNYTLGVVFPNNMGETAKNRDNFFDEKGSLKPIYKLFWTPDPPDAAEIETLENLQAVSEKSPRFEKEFVETEIEAIECMLRHPSMALDGTVTYDIVGMSFALSLSTMLLNLTEVIIDSNQEIIDLMRGFFLSDQIRILSDYMKTEGATQALPVWEQRNRIVQKMLTRLNLPKEETYSLNRLLFSRAAISGNTADDFLSASFQPDVPHRIVTCLNTTTDKGFPVVVTLRKKEPERKETAPVDASGLVGTFDDEEAEKFFADMEKSDIVWETAEDDYDDSSDTEEVFTVEGDDYLLALTLKYAMTEEEGCGIVVRDSPTPPDEGNDNARVYSYLLSTHEMRPLPGGATFNAFCFDRHSGELVPRNTV